MFWWRREEEKSPPPRGIRTHNREECVTPLCHNHDTTYETKITASSKSIKDALATKVVLTDWQSWQLFSNSKADYYHYSSGKPHWTSPRIGHLSRASSPSSWCDRRWSRIRIKTEGNEKNCAKKTPGGNPSPGFKGPKNKSINFESVRMNRNGKDEWSVLLWTFRWPFDH